MTSKKRGAAGDPWTNRSTVVGLFDHQTQAEAAIQALKAAGFPERDIGVAMRDRTSQGELAEGTGTQAAEGAAGGAMGGGVVGGVIGLLGGLGALAIPGLGPIFAAGWLGSTLAGAGIGAAAGGIIGGLVGLGIPENEARHFEEGVKEGRVLVTVKAEGRAAEAAEILRRHDADLGPAFETGSAGVSRSASSTADLADTDQERLQLREEELEVGKERVKAGEVRLRKEVVTEQQQIDVPVTREEVVIERHPVSGDAARTAAGDLAEGEEIRVPIMEEEVRVEKRPVVKEEVTLGKRKVTETQQVNETLRREEAKVETEGDAAVQYRGERERGERYGGTERRRRRDPAYAGPERRLAVR
jgi:uncharacterized protein (TIGR02271 family)